MNVRRWYAAPLMRVNKMLAPRIRNSRLMTRWLFGVDVQKGRRVQYWDYTTLVFRQALLKHVQPRSRTLEIGVGEHRKRRPTVVIACCECQLSVSRLFDVCHDTHHTFPHLFGTRLVG